MAPSGRHACSCAAIVISCPSSVLPLSGFATEASGSWRCRTERGFIVPSARPGYNADAYAGG